MMKDKITIVGGGPSGLFCTYKLLKQGFEVDLYDQMSNVGTKFILAGKGGLNLTHSEDTDLFCTRYGKDRNYFKKLIREFSPNCLESWCHELGIKTFKGSSGRIFPEKSNARELLSAWIKVLKSYSKFNLFLNHRLIDITKEKTITFQTKEKKVEVNAKKVIVALGGASYEKTGSDGLWKDIFRKAGIEVSPFLPMNCGFERQWSEYFIKKIDRTPLKNIVVKIGGHEVKGELMLTPYGIEGGAIYFVSNIIRDQILEKGSAVISIDLRPDFKKEVVLEKLKTRKQKESLSNHLRKALKLDKQIFTLLKELSDSSQFENFEYLASIIKGLKIELTSTRPISEAISTSGGVCFSGLTEDLEVITISGMYVVGEMLDFEAPTGGYLLQGCFSTAFRVVKSISSY